MDQSKLVVLFLIFLIALGVAAWSWVNIFHTPDYNPEKAHHFLETFYMQCSAAHSEEVCDPVVGDYHRQCFNDHLVYPPPEEVEEKGPVLYDLSVYLDCMGQGVDAELSRAGR